MPSKPTSANSNAASGGGFPSHDVVVVRSVKLNERLAKWNAMPLRPITIEMPHATTNRAVVARRGHANTESAANNKMGPEICGAAAQRSFETVAIK